MSRRHRRARRLVLEHLETRTVPSAAADLPRLVVDPTDYDASHILVRFREGVRPDSLGDRIAAIAPDIYRITLADETVEGAVRMLAQRSDILAAEPDYELRVAALPNDPSFSQLWGLHNTGQTGGTLDADIDAPEAWDVGTGTRATVVAVIDTGVDYNHPDLEANIWTNPGEIAGNSVDDDLNGFVDDIHGWDFVNNDNNPMDDHGHGTHVAGTIGAVGNNGVGVAGVNWNTRIMALKFLSASGSGSTSAAIAAVNYAVRMGADVSNNSWGGGGFSQALFDAIAAGRSTGHIFVAAAGNSGLNNDTIAHYPSSYALDNIVSVAATDANNGRASFSNYGLNSVDLGAPGVGIFSTMFNDTYSSLSGTSMATPHVAGALALIRDLHPGWTYREAIARVLSTTDPLTALAGGTVTGGKLNLARAVTDTAGAAVKSAVFNGASGTISSVRLTFSEAINAGSFEPGDAGMAGPGGTVGAASVTPVGATGTVFDVAFPTQSTAGVYTLTVGPDVNDLFGFAMDQNGNGNSGEGLDDAYTTSHTLTVPVGTTFHSADAPKSIRDNRTVISNLVVGQALTPRDVNVKLNITHTYTSDLVITLESPQGTRVQLFNRRGGFGDNLTNTVFDDEAATPISAGAAPFTGSFRPERSLTTYDNRPGQGTWKLRIEDRAGGDVGQLTAWSLTFE